MILEKMATISTDRMEVLVRVVPTGIEIQRKRSLNDALKLIKRRDGIQGNVDKAEKDRVSMDRREDVRINEGNDFFEITRVLSLVQMEMEEFNDLLNNIGWQDVIEIDENGVNRVNRNSMQILSRILRDRTID